MKHFIAALTGGEDRPPASHNSEPAQRDQDEYPNPPTIDKPKEDGAKPIHFELLLKQKWAA